MAESNWEDEANELRAELTKTRRRGHGGGYAPEARQRAVQIAQRARREGESTVSIARELGVHALTLSAWMTKATGRGFAEVVVAKAAPSLTVVSPTGWRIEGLSVDAIRSLLSGPR
jgi:cell division GTPase FtsZ